MTVRQRSSRCCLGLLLVLPPLVQPASLCQTPPIAIGSFDAQRPDANTQLPISAEMHGDLLAVRQRYLDAIAAYRQAPQDSAVVANKIGVAFHHMFDVTDAKRYYERAVQLDPHYAEAWNNLGAIYHAEKNYRQAEHYYRKAIKLNPNSPLFYSNLGTAYFFQGNSKKGAEAYQQAFVLDPEVFERGSAAKIEEGSSTKDLATVNYVLAKTYAHAGMNERALAYLRKAIGEGFSDRKRMMNDPELTSLREMPEFVQLLSLQRTQ